MTDERAKELGILLRFSFPKVNGELLKNWTAWFAERDNGDVAERVIRECSVVSNGFIPDDFRSRVMTDEARAAGITPQRAAEINAQKAMAEAVERRDREQRMREAAGKSRSKAQETLAGLQQEDRDKLREMALEKFAATNPTPRFLALLKSKSWESSPTLSAMMVEQMNPKDRYEEPRRQSANEFLGVQA